MILDERDIGDFASFAEIVTLCNNEDYEKSELQRVPP
jgi:hypothetical protein